MSRTPAQQQVADLLASKLTDDSPYGVGVLLLSYANGDPLGCQIAQGAGINAAISTERAAVELTQTIAALRGLADQLETMIHSYAQKDPRHHART